MMTTKKTLLMIASLGFFALLFYGKFKLGTAKLTLPIIILGGLVFAASSPSEIAAESIDQYRIKKAAQ